MQLSERDMSVLDSIFDPQGDISLVSEENSNFSVSFTNREPRDDQERAAMVKNAQAIRMAESGKLEEAIKILDELIDSKHLLSFAYNNRAQTKRLFDSKYSSEDILMDLSNAISFSEEDNVLAFPIVKKQALMQRACIRLKSGSPDSEGLARVDFEEAGRLGCSDARIMANRLNPYAKMCAATVSLAINQSYYC